MPDNEIKVGDIVEMERDANGKIEKFKAVAKFDIRYSIKAGTKVIVIKNKNGYDLINEFQIEKKSKKRGAKKWQLKQEWVEAQSSG